MAAMTFTINGKAYPVNCDPEMPLLWAIRDIVGLTGTKYGCGVAICKACTVWIDGSAEKSCEKKAREGVGVQITTVEGLAATPMGAAAAQIYALFNAAGHAGDDFSGVINFLRGHG